MRSESAEMMRPARLRTRRLAAGFTLLELLVAVALMAAVSIFAWRGLDAVIGTRDDITRHSDRLRSLALAFGQIEDDLRRSWYARLMVTSEPVIALRALDDPPGVLALELLRSAPPAARLGSDRSGESPGSPHVQPNVLQRVVWRLREGRLERGAVTWQPGVGALGAWVWQPVVRSVDALEWRVWLDGSGWAPQSPPWVVRDEVPGEPTVTSRPLPGGVELMLSVAGERIVRVLAAED
ncbi:MAG: PilD-dependent protein pddD [Pseudomonadota bacterium]